MKKPLNKRTLEAIRPPETGQLWVWDTKLTGFALRVLPSGRKTFIIQYRNAFGRSRKKTLGQFPPLTADRARKIAQVELARVTQGEDPAQERKEALGTLTVKDAAERYFSDYASTHTKARTYHETKRCLEQYVFPSIGGRAITEVSKQDLQKIHRSMKKTPAQANRVVRVASGLFTFCFSEGILAPGAVHPARGIAFYKERKRERFLSIEEISQMGVALAQLEETGEFSSIQCDALRLVLLTGCRVGEILNLTWEEVDLEHQLLLLGDSKTGQKAVALGTPEVEVLCRIPKTGTYVFPSPKKSLAPLSTLRGPWKRVCEVAEIEKARIHDLRHTTASVGAGLGISLQMIGKVLGHTQVSTTARYAHLADDPFRVAKERMSKTIAAALANQKPAEVIPLHQS